MTFFTADLHFSNRGVILYCKRPFVDSYGKPDVHEMNKCMTGNWNSAVGKDDKIYLLGDICMTGVGNTRAILEKLNGRKYLIKGDHDRSTIRCPEYFEKIADTMFISINGQGIFLSHYCHKTWRKSHYGSWHLFGHSHGGLNRYAAGEGKLLDVGVDSHDFRPWAFGEVKEIMATRPDNFNFVGKGRGGRYATT